MYTFLEYTMTTLHKKRIAAARAEHTHTPATKRKISRSMEGKKNHEGERHGRAAKKKISQARGSYDPIRGRHWIVNVTNKTYRRYETPIGYKPHQRTYRDRKNTD